MRVLNEKSPVVGDVWLQRAPDGSRRYLSANAGPILDRHGEVVGCVVAWRDVTAVKENEQALQRRTEELAGANKELEAFSYSVSHDLRAPLRTMTGFSDFLMEDYGDKLDEEGKELLERIKAAGAKMNALIEDILSLSRISRQEMSIEEVDLGDMARAFVEELKRTQPERPVDIRIQENLKTRGDPRLLDVALSNLIRNAWKYTGKTENPVIELGAFERHGETVYYVRDNGAGFDMAHADNLFAPFRRLHTDTEFPGTGVGLAIVERVIRRHGGRVWAEGQVGRGACFYFTVG
jgi:light-regulated signal transduction histidine kinase (bacteriophytochrome)